MATATAQKTGTSLTTEQAAVLAQQAGFSGQALETILAIAWAESSLRTGVVGGPNNNGTFDYGILQINSVHMGQQWPGGTMTVSQALDPAIAFKFGYWLSKQGTNFGPWSTFNNGRYTAYLQTVEQALGTIGLPTKTNPGTGLPPYTGRPWYQFTNLHNYGVGPEHGTDLETPPDTPMTAILAGTVTDVGYYPWGGQITWQLDNPSAAHGVPYEYIIHLDAINPQIKKGSHLDAGTFLGYSGGELPGQVGNAPQLPVGYSHHATDPQYSTGWHEEIGLTYGPVYGTGSGYINTAQHPEANPDFLLTQASAQSLPFSTTIGTNGSVNFPLTTLVGTGSGGGGTAQFDDGKTTWDALSTKVHNTLVQYPGFYGIAAALDEAEQFQGAYVSQDNPYWFGQLNPANSVVDWWESIVGTVFGNALPVVIRGTMIGLGVFIIMAFIWQMMKPTLEFLPELLALA